MIFTDLTYLQVGGILGIISLLFFTVVVVIRFVLAFYNYIYNGDFGDYEKSMFGEMMEHSNFFSIYIFTGYHPGILMMDAVVFFIFSILIIPLWGACVITGFLLLLGKIMRKRIAIKQDFLSKLKGIQDE